MAFSQLVVTHLDSLITDLYLGKGFSGNVLIAKNEAILFAKAYGFEDLKESRALNLDSRFELASVTKQFTAFAIAVLEKQGKINSSQSIDHFFPQLTHYNEIRISDLIHHTSGLPEYDEGAWKYDGNHFITNDSIISYLERVKPTLSFDPGSSYKYTNTGYVLLASLIEKVTGESYSDFLRNKIFLPAGMHKSLVYRRRFQPEFISNIAEGYITVNGLRQLPDSTKDYNYVVHLDGIYGDGMVNSTALDLLKWHNYLAQKSVIETFGKLLFSPDTLTNNTSNPYGYGWRLETNSKYGKIVKHSGGWPGYVTYVERHLDSGFLVVFLQNNYDNFSIPIKKIRKIIYQEKPRRSIPVSQKQLKVYAGSFEFEDDKTVLNVTIENDKLLASYQGESFFLKPYQEDKFFVVGDEEIEISFSKGYTTATWIQGEYVGHLKRLNNEKN